MKQNEVSYDDSSSRQIVQDVMWDVYGLGFRDGPKYGVDLIGEKFDIEIEVLNWTRYSGTILASREFRVPTRKGRYWIIEGNINNSKKPTQLVQLNHDMSEVILWENYLMVQFINNPDIRKMENNGWSNDKNEFYTWSKKFTNRCKYFKQEFDAQWCVADKFRPHKNGNGATPLFTKENTYYKQFNRGGEKIQEQSEMLNI